MPPEGDTTITVSDSVAATLTRIIARHECSSYAAAITYAADTTLVQDDEITLRELVQRLAERVDMVDETVLQ